MTPRFVWHDLMTPDPEAAKAFYTELFGWTVQPWDMGEHGTYNMLANNEAAFGGVNKLDANTGAPPHWMCYLSCPGSIDDTCAKIASTGGKVVQPPFPIPDVGKMAVASDPQGAFFSPFEPGSPDDTPPPSPTPKGGVAWHELLTSDPAAAAAFYAGITNATPNIMDMGTGPYTILQNGSEMIGGIMTLPEGMTMPAWVIYYEIVQDTMEAALAEVKRLGGEVGMGPMEIPTVGTIGAVADPTGAWFCLMKSAM